MDRRQGEPKACSGGEFKVEIGTGKKDAWANWRESRKGLSDVSKLFKASPLLVGQQA